MTCVPVCSTSMSSRPGAAPRAHATHEAAQSLREPEGGAKTGTQGISVNWGPGQRGSGAHL